MMGFTSTQTHAIAADNLPSFETLKGVTDQWPSGYFAAGCAAHLSHLYLDLDTWYGMDYADRVKRMFSPRTPVPSDQDTVTIRNGPDDVATMEQVKQDAATGVLSHNALLQQAAHIGATTYDNYGRRRVKGTSVPLREDFNTLDDPFFWAPGGVGPVNKPGMHFVAFLPGHHLFHRARTAMDGVMPDGTNFRSNISDENNGINARMRASHRQKLRDPPAAQPVLPAGRAPSSKRHKGTADLHSVTDEFLVPTSNAWCGSERKE